ncbi:MAG: hypothetical protein IPO66_13645 [Rhodanobacteraceae bacterium]|nr:hypothetical protein [Rhodanobacteraceae bacterium]
MTQTPTPDTRPSALQLLLSVRKDERALLALSGLFFFLVMAGYFILRPIRDQMGVAGGVDNLAWLFSGTLLAMLAINPLFSMLVSRWPRPRFVAFSYRALMLCLAGFYLALVGLPEASQVWIGRVFFIWVSVFNLFAVSVFWAVMADVFQSEQSRRLYGVIAAGGSLGALVGGLLTSSLVAAIGAPALLLVSLVTLELALWCMFAINRRVNLVAAAAQRPQDEVVGGSALDGFRMALRSPYLLGMCGYMLLYTIGSTFLYFLQAQVVAGTIDGKAAQTAYFANVDVWVNGLTLLLQLFLTGRLMARIGVGLTLAALPLISMVGFAGPGPDAGAGGRGGVHRGAPGDQLRAVAPGARDAVRAAQPQREVQGQEPHRHRGLPRRRPARRVDQRTSGLARFRHRRHRLERGAAGRAVAAVVAVAGAALSGVAGVGQYLVAQLGRAAPRLGPSVGADSFRDPCAFCGSGFIPRSLAPRSQRLAE